MPEEIMEIKFFVISEDYGPIEGFQSLADAQNYIDKWQHEYKDGLTIFSVNSCDDDAEIERVRENYYFVLTRDDYEL